MYKERPDRFKRFQNFEENELVIVHLKDRFPAGLYSKLKDRNFGSCTILRKINGMVLCHQHEFNIVDFPPEFNMSSTFNVTDLRKYYPPEN